MVMAHELVMMEIRGFGDGDQKHKNMAIPCHNIDLHVMLILYAPYGYA